MHAANQIWSDKLTKSGSVNGSKIQLFALCWGDTADANRFQRKMQYFLWPHLWQRCFHQGRGWLAVLQRRALWPASVCGGRWRATSQEIYLHPKTCGIGSIEHPVNKCKLGEGSWGESGKEKQRAHKDKSGLNPGAESKQVVKYCSYIDHRGLNSY